MYEKIETCPVCDNTNFENFLICADYRVTNESFAIVQCSNCQLLLTNPRPVKDDLLKYYDSEDYISHTNRSNTLIDYLYKIARKYSIRKKYKLISKYKSDGPILDVGCGTGQFLEYYKSMGWDISGIEPVDIARQQAEKLLDQELYKDLQQVSGKFHVITLWHVLEHLSDINNALLKIKTLMNKDSILIIAVPNYRSYDARKYNSYWAGYDVPRHLYHFSRTSMNRFLKKQNLKLIHTYPLKLDAYYVSLLSEEYKNRNNFIIKYTRSFINAWKSNTYANSSGEYSSLIYIISK